MSTIYRIIEHKDHKNQARDLAQSLGSGDLAKEGYALASGISEIYRGEIKPIVLEPRPYLPVPSGVDTQLSHKILVRFEGEWWLTDNPEQEFGVPEWYIDLPTLPNCPGEGV